MNEIELKRIIEHKYGNIRAFAVENDIPYTTMRSILERGMLNAKAETIFKICRILNIRPESIEGVDLYNTSNIQVELIPSTLQKITTTSSQLDHKRQLVVLDTAEKQLEEQESESTVSEFLVEYHVYERLSAGTGEAVYEDYNYDTVFYKEEIDHDIASWVWGDSMEPKYLNGEVALIKETGFDYDGAIYAVVWDGQTYIKKVYREKEGLRLVSLNKKYGDKFAPYDEEPRIIGLVVGHFMPMEN